MQWRTFNLNKIRSQIVWSVGRQAGKQYPNYSEKCEGKYVCKPWRQTETQTNEKEDGGAHRLNTRGRKG